MMVSKPESHDASLSVPVNVDGPGLKDAIRLVEATPESPLSFCFVVPEDVFGVWENRVITVPGGVDPRLIRWYVVRIDATRSKADFQ